ncbi:hypothetical protein KJ763_01790 [Patescibacteria group bacterium]|nr:hypothetical protein [Patescibacteria group bacterium]
MKNMLGIAEVKGSIYDLLEKLGGSDGERWLRDLKKFLRKEISLIHDWQNFWLFSFWVSYFIYNDYLL